LQRRLLDKVGDLRWVRNDIVGQATERTVGGDHLEAFAISNGISFDQLAALANAPWTGTIVGG
jgi:hypothetical protein